MNEGMDTEMRQLSSVADRLQRDALEIHAALQAQLEKTRERKKLQLERQAAIARRKQENQVSALINCRLCGVRLIKVLCSGKGGDARWHEAKAEGSAGTLRRARTR